MQAANEADSARRRPAEGLGAEGPRTSRKLTDGQLAPSAAPVALILGIWASLRALVPSSPEASAATHVEALQGMP